MSTVRKADYLANQVLLSAGLTNCISQMQVVLVPVSVHMDRSPLKTVPSCARCIAIRLVEKDTVHLRYKAKDQFHFEEPGSLSMLLSDKDLIFLGKLYG